MDLPSSRLGTKEHWDRVYGSELANFHELGDEGEIWFGEESVEKMVDWALDNAHTSHPPAILEIGSGNGSLLFSLMEHGFFAGRMCGIDYSADAVKLAEAVASKRPEGASDITFVRCDFLRDEVPVTHTISQHDKEWTGWDLVLDKGTFDAIALGEKADGKSPASLYPLRLARLLKPGGFFLITSCNFTEDELRTQFASAETGLVYHSRVPHRTFTFGGQKGNVVSTVAFQKQSRKSSK